MRALLIPFALLIGNSAWADFKSDYKEGLRAAEKKNWQEVETSMREALRQEPNSQARVRIYGMRFEPYLPHHYLALAASARNDCGKVMASLNNASHVAALAQSNGGNALAAAERGLRARCEGAQLANTQTKPPEPTSTNATSASNTT